MQCSVMRTVIITGGWDGERGEECSRRFAIVVMLILHKTPTVKFLPLVNVNDVGAAQKATFRFKCNPGIKHHHHYRP